MPTPHRLKVQQIAILSPLLDNMNVLVYPSTHPHASLVQQSLSSVLVPHYLPQIISPDVLAAPENPWRTACRLLVLLSAPDHHSGVRQYAESGGSILALGVNATRTRGLFGLHDTTSSFGSLGGGLGLIKDTTILRLLDRKASIHLSFPSHASSPAIVNYDGQEIASTRVPSASLSLGEGIRVLARYADDDDAVAGALSESGTIALWSSAPPLPEPLLVSTLSALGLRFDFTSSGGGEKPGPRLLPQLLLAHPEKWAVRDRIVHALFPDRDLETTFSKLTMVDGSREVTASESALFPDEQDIFQFHIVHQAPIVDLLSEHPILSLLSGEPKEEVKNVILPPQPLTAEKEKHYTPLFSPGIYFGAVDEFRPAQTDGLLMGDLLLYGEVVTSTQTMLEKNPKLLGALPSPLLSLATKQVAGRGRGKNVWLSPAGSMLMSLRISIPLRSLRSDDTIRSIRPSNLVFIQYLFSLAVVEACQALDPAKGWATRVKLKWPNDIYGEFPAEEAWKSVELKKLGGVLVNTSFRGKTVDVIVGCGLNVLNEPPIGSLAQLEALTTRGQEARSSLTVERVTAAVVTTFERLWNSFIAEESEGFRPFMHRYTNAWLHSGQTVTLTTMTPDTTVRIVGITPEHGLLRTVPLSGGQYIDLQPDGNSFDMMKGLIKTKTN